VGGAVGGAVAGLLSDEEDSAWDTAKEAAVGGVIDGVTAGVGSKFVRGAQLADEVAEAAKGAGKVARECDEIVDAAKQGGSWTKARQEYWRRRAADASDGEFSPENLQRMREGRPPLHDEVGVPKELHHKVPQREGGTHTPDNLDEVWPWEHSQIDPYRHYNGPTP
jgi:hypothetical protein